MNLWTTHPLSSGLPLFLIPELRAVSGNLRQPEVKCFAYKYPAPEGGRRLYAAKHLTEQPPIDLSLADACGAKRRPHSA